MDRCRSGVFASISVYAHALLFQRQKVGTHPGPDAFAENFLTEEECDHIVSLAEPRLQRSGVVNTDTGGSEVSEIRTSQGVFLERNEDPIIAGGWQRWL